MKITSDADTLTISETPGMLWVVGIFFFCVGASFVYGGLGGFSNWDRVPLWQNRLAALMGLAGVIVGIRLIVRAPVMKLVADRVARRVTIVRRGLAGKSTEVHAFDDIRAFLLLEESDDEGCPIWTFSLRLKDEEVVRISSLGVHDEDFERRFVFTANEFIGKQLTAAEMILEEGE